MVKRGRPPILYEREELPPLGEDLLEWVDTDGKESLMFVEWYHNKHGMFLQDWKELIQRPDFRPYYDIARRKLASNVVKNKDIPQSYGNRYLGMYDRDVHDYEQEVRELEAALKDKKSSDFGELAENLQKMGDFFEKVRSMQTSESTTSVEHRKD